jgi:hypothetical protein
VFGRRGARRGAAARGLDAAQPVEEGVEDDRDDGGQQNAGFQQRLQHGGQLLEEVTRHQRDHAEADRDRHNKQIAAIGLEIDIGEDACAPVAATMPNITSPAPPTRSLARVAVGVFQTNEALRNGGRSPRHIR